MRRMTVGAILIVLSVVAPALRAVCIRDICRRSNLVGAEGLEPPTFAL